MIKGAGFFSSRIITQASFTLVLLAGTAWGGLFTAGKTNPSPAAPDIILVMVDSLRADALGCYGEPLPTSPIIDRFASTAVRFEKAFASAPWTQPSVMSMFTSLEPARHGMVLPTSSVASNVTTLAECLKQAGYQTVGITANPMAHRRYGFARGFDHFDDYTIVMEPGKDLMKAAAQAAGQKATGAEMTRLAESRLRNRDPEKPLFMFLFYMDPHWDYIPPAAYGRLFTDDPTPPPTHVYSLGQKLVSPQARKRMEKAYAGEVRYTDDCIGRLLAAVRNSVRSASTAIVLCGDHGESFWERGLPGHGNNLHEEELHVPLIIALPGSAFTGSVVTGQVGLIDLAPTIADLAGAQIPPSWEGVSLKPSLANGKVPARPLILDNRIQGGVKRGVRTDDYKLVAIPPFLEPAEFYDLKADPDETNNLTAGSNSLPDAAVSLMSLIKASDTHTTALTSKGTTL